MDDNDTNSCSINTLNDVDEMALFDMVEEQLKEPISVSGNNSAPVAAGSTAAVNVSSSSSSPTTFANGNDEDDDDAISLSSDSSSSGSSSSSSSSSDSSDSEDEVVLVDLAGQKSNTEGGDTAKASAKETSATATALVGNDYSNNSMSIRNQNAQFLRPPTATATKSSSTHATDSGTSIAASRTNTPTSTTTTLATAKQSTIIAQVPQRKRSLSIASSSAQIAIPLIRPSSISSVVHASKKPPVVVVSTTTVSSSTSSKFNRNDPMALTEAPTSLARLWPDPSDVIKAMARWTPPLARIRRVRDRGGGEREVVEFVGQIQSLPPPQNRNGRDIPNPLLKQPQRHTGGKSNDHSSRNNSQTQQQAYTNAHELMSTMAYPLMMEGLASINNDYHAEKYANGRWNRDLYHLK